MDWGNAHQLDQLPPKRKRDKATAAQCLNWREPKKNKACWVADWEATLTLVTSVVSLFKSTNEVPVASATYSTLSGVVSRLEWMRSRMLETNGNRSPNGMTCDLNFKLQLWETSTNLTNFKKYINVDLHRCFSFFGFCYILWRKCWRCKSRVLSKKGCWYPLHSSLLPKKTFSWLNYALHWRCTPHLERKILEDL